MITYEEAKEIAMKQAEMVGVQINAASELPYAYIFDDAEHEYAGVLPMVVRKSDGKVFNYRQYMVRTNSKGDDVREIGF